MDDLTSLIEMTRALGEPHRNYVIIGEGNTSCRIDEDRFYIKASGQKMDGISADGFVAVHFAPILELFDNPPADSKLIQQIMEDARRRSRMDLNFTV